MSGKRVVVATATKNLQDQLAQKDAPTVAANAPGVRVAVLKGKQNYLCRNRVHSVGGGTQLSFDDGSDVPKGVADQMRTDPQVVERDRDGRPRRAALRGRPARVAGTVGHSPGVPAPGQLSPGSELFRRVGEGPRRRVVHPHRQHPPLRVAPRVRLDAVAGARVRGLRRSARDRRHLRVAAGHVAQRHATARDWPASRDHSSAPSSPNALWTSSRWPTASPHRCRSSTTATNSRVSTKTAPANSAGPTNSSSRSSRDFACSSRAAPTRRRGRSAPSDRPIHLANDLARVNNVRVGELLFISKRDREVDVEISLVDVGPRLADDLWGNVTAHPHQRDHSRHVAEEAWVSPVPPIEHFDSPFDYAANSLLYVPDNFPSRNDAGAEAAIIEELVELITAAGGRTLALFTNRSVMNRVADAVAPRLETEVLVQGTRSRQRIIEEFRDSAEASLFAVASFWQGIDVPGHSLSLVTIDRLPFAVPNDPLAEARRANSERPFYEVDLPRATMLLAQGVGRLIRNNTDRGVVAVLDTRLAESSYRSAMFRKLPPMKRTRDRAQVLAFLRELRA